MSNEQQTLQEEKVVLDQGDHERFSHYVKKIE
jgi:hypothetical protein